MKQLTKDRLHKAKEQLREKLPFKKIKQIPKYKNLSLEQYLMLLTKLESIALFVIESYLNQKQL